MYIYIYIYLRAVEKAGGGQGGTCETLVVYFSLFIEQDISDEK